MPRSSAVLVAMSGPVMRPWQCDNPPPAGDYRPMEPVWMWSHDRNRWLPGEVGSASDAAVLIRFALPDGGGTAVDTVRPEYVMHRDDGDQP